MGTQLQSVSHQRTSNRAIMELRQRRYLKQDNLGYPILVLHIPTHRLDEPSIAVEEVNIRCECCNDACKLG